MNKLAIAAFAFLAATGIALAGVDANTASRAELESISGIGPATSSRIVEERRKRPFADTQDLMRRVKGIGEARLSRMVAAGLSVGGNGVIVTTGGRGERNRAPRHRQAWPGDAAHREGHATVTRPESRPRLYWRLVRMHRPIGILLLLWPTLWALLIASADGPPPYLLFAFVLGTVLMRSAGCAINDFADRDFDRHVARTRDRPLTAGLIAPWEAVDGVRSALPSAALALIIPINRADLAAGRVRRVPCGQLPVHQAILRAAASLSGHRVRLRHPDGVCGGPGPTCPATAWLMLLANIFWAIAYDTEYAMVDRDDDLKIGIRTAAITFGRFDVAAVMLCYAASLGLLALVGRIEGLGLFYYLGLAGAGGYRGVSLSARSAAAAARAAFARSITTTGSAPRCSRGLALQYGLG